MFLKNCTYIIGGGHLLLSSLTSSVDPLEGGMASPWFCAVVSGRTEHMIPWESVGGIDMF